MDADPAVPAGGAVERRQYVDVLGALAQQAAQVERRRTGEQRRLAAGQHCGHAGLGVALVTVARGQPDVAVRVVPPLGLHTIGEH
jgi:hypothetical protein